MKIKNDHIYYSINGKKLLKKYTILLVLIFSAFSLKAQPDPDMFNKQQLNLLTQQINESDTTNYILHWRRAKLLGGIAGRFELLEPLDKKTIHNYFINDIGLLIDNEIVLEGLKEVTIAHYYFTRANYYLFINEQDKAIEDYKIALEKDDRELITKQANYRLLDIYEYNKNYDAALIYCEKLIKQVEELGGDYCSCEAKSSICYRKAELMYKAGKYKELLDYLKDLFGHSYNKKNSNQDVYCYLNLYRHYYALVTPSGLSKYEEEDLNQKTVNTILRTMVKLNSKVE